MAKRAIKSTATADLIPRRSSSGIDSARVQELMAGKSIKNVIVVPGRLVNIVVAC